MRFRQEYSHSQIKHANLQMKAWYFALFLYIYTKVKS